MNGLGIHRCHSLIGIQDQNSSRTNGNWCEDFHGDGKINAVDLVESLRDSPDIRGGDLSHPDHCTTNVYDNDTDPTDMGAGTEEETNHNGRIDGDI